MDKQLTPVEREAIAYALEDIGVQCQDLLPNPMGANFARGDGNWVVVAGFGQPQGVVYYCDGLFTWCTVFDNEQAVADQPLLEAVK